MSRHGTIEEKMLRGFLRVRVAHFALCGEANLLEPGPDQETLVEDQLDECAHLPWARVVPVLLLGGKGVRVRLGPSKLEEQWWTVDETN